MLKASQAKKLLVQVEQIERPLGNTVKDFDSTLTVKAMTEMTRYNKKSTNRPQALKLKGKMRVVKFRANPDRDM